MKTNKIFSIILCLFLPLFTLTNCAKKPDLTGFYKAGENFSLSYAAEFECDISVLEINDEYFSVEINNISLNENSEVYIYSKGFSKVICNGEIFTEEEWLPTIIPVGVYSIPFEADSIVLQIYFAQDYDYPGNGYIKATVDTAYSSSHDYRFGIEFVAY